PRRESGGARGHPHVPTDGGAAWSHPRVPRADAVRAYQLLQPGKRIRTGRAPRPDVLDPWRQGRGLPAHGRVTPTRRGSGLTAEAAPHYVAHDTTRFGM